ncbi:MAG: nucleoside monophosphate kinase [Paludibacteraceae bacterium]|nr:nucleoside monophosphate kinase [Paludibacteraceae bacterium]
MLNIILGGAPGSGKGTLSDIIVEHYGLQHLSTGDVLRAEIASGSKLGQEINEIISFGNLIPDEQMIQLLKNYIKNLPADCKGVIFDGFPRTVEQAHALTQMLDEHHMDAYMLDLWAEEDTIIERLLNRGKTSGRADDNLETIKKRLRIYNETTRPISDYYLRRHRYFLLNSNINPECTWSQMDVILKQLMIDSK